MSISKIMFVNLPSVPVGAENVLPTLAAMPLGILYLSAYIKEYTNVEVKLWDISLGEDMPNFNPDIIGWSINFTTSWPAFKEKINEAKKRWPNAIHIAGGNYPTNATEEVLDYVDYVFKGEAEEVLIEFINGNRADRVVQCKEINLDNLLLPDWQILNIGKYLKGLNRARANNKIAASIMTSRGCPFSCTFCSSHLIHGRKLRVRSIDNVLYEIKALNQKYGVNLFIIEDDLFGAPKKHYLELLKEIKKLNIEGIELQYPNALSVAVIDEELIDAMSEFTNIFNIAIETACKKTQRAIKKNVNLDKAKRLVKHIRDNGNIARCYFMLGFPRETKEDMVETIEYAKELGADWSRFALVVPLVGSEMASQFTVSNNGSFQDRTFNTKEISAEELKEIAYRANLEINFFNNINVKEGKYERAKEQFSDVLKRYPFHVAAKYMLEEDIGDMIKTDKTAKDMYDKYIDLFDKNRPPRCHV